MPMPPAGDRSLARTAVQLVGKYIHVGARRRIIATRAPRDLTPRGTIPYRGGHLGYAVYSNAIVACVLASRMVYKEGVQFIASLPEEGLAAPST